MDALRKRYETQIKDYESLVKQSVDVGDVSQLPKLREMNTAIGKTLNDMIEQLTFLKKDTPKLKQERDELINRLRRIQQDYNGLLVNTDKLETLRRIRQQENGEAEQQMRMFLFFFLAVCLAIFLYLLIATQRKDTTAPRASMPPTTAAFV
jgi:DNA repair exonuclease SbcCD ATPase subunit